MIKQVLIAGTTVLLAIGLSACSDEPAVDGPANDEQEAETQESGEGDPVEQPDTGKETEKETTDKNADMEGIDGEEISPVQKQMAIDVLNAIFKDAEDGIVYGLSSGFTVGESARQEVYAQISEPEERIGGYDYYHGLMGNASYKILYDENDVMKEARYFGTNVERQTNLGGITREDLFQEQGEPNAERKIPDTGETNLIYYVGDYELQFVIREDGSTDHVNLLEQGQ